MFTLAPRGGPKRVISCRADAELLRRLDYLGEGPPYFSRARAMEKMLTELTRGVLLPEEGGPVRGTIRASDPEAVKKEKRPRSCAAYC